MGKPIKLKEIKEEKHRQKSFYNRKEGLFSKVNQLSVLCGVQSFLVIVDKKNFVYIYSSEEDYMNSLNAALSNKKNIKNFYTKQNFDRTFTETNNNEIEESTEKYSYITTNTRKSDPKNVLDTKPTNICSSKNNQQKTSNNISLPLASDIQPKLVSSQNNNKFKFDLTDLSMIPQQQNTVKPKKRPKINKEALEKLYSKNNYEENNNATYKTLKDNLGSNKIEANLTNVYEGFLNFNNPRGKSGENNSANNYHLSNKSTTCFTDQYSSSKFNNTTMNLSTVSNNHNNYSNNNINVEKDFNYNIDSKDQSNITNIHPNNKNKNNNNINIIKDNRDNGNSSSLNNTNIIKNNCFKISLNQDINNNSSNIPSSFTPVVYNNKNNNDLITNNNNSNFYNSKIDVNNNNNLNPDSNDNINQENPYKSNADSVASTGLKPYFNVPTKSSNNTIMGFFNNTFGNTSANANTNNNIFIFPDSEMEKESLNLMGNFLIDNTSYDDLLTNEVLQTIPNIDCLDFLKHKREYEGGEIGKNEINLNNSNNNYNVNNNNCNSNNSNSKKSTKTFLSHHTNSSFNPFKLVDDMINVGSNINGNLLTNNNNNNNKNITNANNSNSFIFNNQINSKYFNSEDNRTKDRNYEANKNWPDT